VRFDVVPDATTQGPRTTKGQRDLTINSPMPPDAIVTLERDPSLIVQRGAGTRLAYLAFNLRSDLERCAGPASHRLRSGPAADDRVFMAQPGSSGKQHYCRDKAGPTTATCSGTITIPAKHGNCSTLPDIHRERCPLSSHHEDIDQ